MVELLTILLVLCLGTMVLVGAFVGGIWFVFEVTRKAMKALFKKK